MENIKLPDTWQQEAERSSELQEGTYTPQHKVTYKHGFTDGSQSMLTAVEKHLKNKSIEVGKDYVFSDEDEHRQTGKLFLLEELLTELKSIQP